MGKSNNKKKKSLPSTSSAAAAVSPELSRIPDPPSSSSFQPPPSSASINVENLAFALLRRAYELKEEGNRCFQRKEYQSALEHYDHALKLTPRNHPDRAIFHSNKAACLMQMKPVHHESVIRECTLALETQPKFSRALFRRARAFEAIGKHELALRDVQMILQQDAAHQDALELEKRVRIALGHPEEAQRDTEGRTLSTLSSSSQSSYVVTSPASLGASVVRGSPSPAANRGPSLPARPLQKKGAKPEQLSPRLSGSEPKKVGSFIPVNASPDVSPQVRGNLNSSNSSKPEETLGNPKLSNGNKSSSVDHSSTKESSQKGSSKKSNQINRPLKLVYGHDIRLARMPLNCKFAYLREIVRKRFPSSKAVLIKYRDHDGDLITITSTEELRLAEGSTITEVNPEKPKDASMQVNEKEPDVQPVLLRLHVVEVSAEQEPTIEEEEEEDEEECLDDLTAAQTDQTLEQNVSISRKEEPTSSSHGKHMENQNATHDLTQADHSADKEEEISKEIEIDEWFLDFANLFRTHIGVDPDAHVDLHELGMELCSEALEETVTSEEAQPLLESAACKFQEVAALAFFNWGNVHMCAARKRMPSEENAADKSTVNERVKEAFEWARSQYEIARSKYEEALRVKPDFYEGVLALGQESFENAKLHWSLAMANHVDLSSWDSSQTLACFKQAEERMQIAFEMWESFEARKLEEIKSTTEEKESSKPDGRGKKDGQQRLSEAETREQLRATRLQINLFWGNILFEHSQVEFKLGLSSWKTLLDVAVKKFELAGACPSDIVVVLKNHVANVAFPDDFIGRNVNVQGCSTQESTTDSTLNDHSDQSSSYKDDSDVTSL